jgi:hypothetical protein
MQLERTKIESLEHAQSLHKKFEKYLDYAFKLNPTIYFIIYHSLSNKFKLEKYIKREESKFWQQEHKKKFKQTLDIFSSQDEFSYVRCFFHCKVWKKLSENGTIISEKQK